MRRAPIASTRACSTASKMALAVSPSGSMRRWIAGLWQASLSAIESAWPRRIAASPLLIRRGGSGRRTRACETIGFSAAKPTSSSGLPAIARKHAATARLKGSAGGSALLFFVVFEIDISAQRHVHRRLGQVAAEAALVELRHDRPLQLVAFVEEGQPEGEADVAENLGVLRPGNHRAWAHDGRDVAVDEGRAGQIRNPHHLRDDVAAFGRAVLPRLGADDVHFLVVRQIVEGGHDRPAVHLSLIDLLGAVIKAGGVAEADRIRGRKQPERRMRADHLVL